MGKLPINDGRTEFDRSQLVEIFQVHPQALSALREFAKLSGKSAKDLAAFIASNIEALNSPSDAYTLSVEHPVKGVEQQTVFALVDALAGFVYEALPSASDADDVANSLVVSAQRVARNSAAGPFSEAALRKLRANLLAVFDNSVIRLKAKALRLLNAHERAFTGSEVFSDIRPVLKVDGGMTVEAAVVYHTLRIRHTGVDRSFSVALDSHDLRELKAAVDRAIDKETALSKMIASAGVEQVKVS